MKVEFLPGTDIFTAAKEAIRVAEHLNVGIKFNFNGIECNVWPGDSPEKLQEKYHSTDQLFRPVCGH
jgi:hypothetical protein